MRRGPSEIKLHTLSHLGRYLEEFERNATANGMVVHWASDAREMNRIVLDILRRHGGRTLIKSKSMLFRVFGNGDGEGFDLVAIVVGEAVFRRAHGHDRLAHVDGEHLVVLLKPVLHK